MPYINFGESLPKTSGNFTRLKTVGEKLQFRILGMPFVEGNHFFSEDGQWIIMPCLRINNQESCDYCNKLFKALKSIPRIEDKDEYRKAVNKAKEGVPGCDPGITYNFPVINRDTESFTTFKATPGIRNMIEAEFALGTKVLDVDFVAVNTGKKGKGRYALTRVDSAETKDLTPKEIEIKENFDPKEFEVSIGGQADESGGVAFEANSEVEEEAVERM